MSGQQLQMRKVEAGEEQGGAAPPFKPRFDKGDGKPGGPRPGGPRGPRPGGPGAPGGAPGGRPRPAGDRAPRAADKPAEGADAGKLAVKRVRKAAAPAAGAESKGE